MPHYVQICDGHSACGTATFMPNLSGRAGLKRCVLRVIQTTGGATLFRRAIAAAHGERLACAPSSARGDRLQRIARPAHARGAHTIHAPFRLSPPPCLLYMVGKRTAAGAHVAHVGARAVCSSLHIQDP